MRRADVVALAQGALVGALAAGAGVLIWTAASGPAGFPTTDAALPSPSLLPTPTVRPELPDATEGAAREFEVDGPDGIHGSVEDSADGSRVISLWAGTTCFDNTL